MMIVMLLSLAVRPSLFIELGMLLSLVALVLLTFRVATGPACTRVRPLMVAMVAMVAVATGVIALMVTGIPTRP